MNFRAVKLLSILLLTTVSLCAHGEGVAASGLHSRVEVITEARHRAEDRLLTSVQNNEAKTFARETLHLEPSSRLLLHRLLNGLEFIDFGHAAPELAELFLKRKDAASVQFPELYDTPTEPAFSSFVRARQLFARAGSLTVGLIKSIQMAAVPWENSSGLGPGTLRSRYVYGPEFEHGLAPDQLKMIEENPYLRFMPATGIYADAPQGVESARSGDRVRGAIVYARPRDLKLQALRRIQPTHPDLVKRVLAYQREYGADFGNRDEALTRELIEALLEERVRNFNRDVEKLGPLTSAKDVRTYIAMIAQFQKDFASIHPFPDGNGRVSRLLLYGLAEQKGLPAPRLVYPNEDVFWPLFRWQEQIRNGMIATLRLKNDLLARLKSGKPPGESVYLLMPTGPTEQDVSPDKYEAFVRHEFENPSLLDNLKRDPVGAVRGLNAEFDKRAPARKAVPVPLTCSALFGGAA